MDTLSSLSAVCISTDGVVHTTPRDAQVPSSTPFSGILPPTGASVPDDASLPFIVPPHRPGVRQPLGGAAGIGYLGYRVWHDHGAPDEHDDSAEHQDGVHGRHTPRERGYCLSCALHGDRVWINNRARVSNGDALSCHTCYSFVQHQHQHQHYRDLIVVEENRGHRWGRRRSRDSRCDRCRPVHALPQQAVASPLEELGTGIAMGEFGWW